MQPHILPTIAHFGCGRLGTAAVLPFLIHKYGSTHRIVAIQRRSKSWDHIPIGNMIIIRTNVGDFMPFHTLQLDGAVDTLSSEKRQLIFVPAISQCKPLLHALKVGSPELIVTCSLSGGQGELVHLLKASDSWDKALIFENTPAAEWKEYTEGASKKAYPVIVDRICWDVEPYNINNGILSHCEHHKYVRFDWPASANIPATPAPDGNRHGAHVFLSDQHLRSFPDDDLTWQHFRKRALINAPHSIAALLCYRLLAVRGMSAVNQYLAPLQVMLQQERPQWYEAMDHYFRLRAVEVAWRRYKGNTEALHNEFRRAYGKAKEAEQRFFESNDRLDRLMVRDNFGRELSRLREHIFEPLAFYGRECKFVRQQWIYGRPNDIDVKLLRDFLDDSFVEAEGWLAKH
jgi:hypothetical protein